MISLDSASLSGSPLLLVRAGRLDGDLVGCFEGLGSPLPHTRQEPTVR